jgi:arylsulfatase
MAACDGGSGRPTIVLVSLDTTRADHLSCYGYEIETSPRLDELAAQSLVFERAISTSSWTLPAHASMFTGKFTSGHGARYDPNGPLNLSHGIGGQVDAYRVRGLATNETTLAGVLAEYGYATGAVVAGPWMKSAFTLDKGFDHYDDARIDSVTGRLAEDVTDSALAWLDEIGERPAFAFLNYYDAHSPYGAPEPYTFKYLQDATREGFDFEDRSRWIELYDAEIAYADHHLGRFLDGLRERGLYDDALIVVTADHGEHFGEQGEWGHGRFLFRQGIHVPFVAKLPGQVPERRTEHIQAVDIMPLILDELGLPIPEGIQGGVPPDVGHPIVAEIYPLDFVSAAGFWRALYKDDWKAIWNSNGDHRLYNLAADPMESNNLVNETGEFSYLSQVIKMYLSSLPVPGASEAREVDAETLKALRNLGYVR